MKKKSPAEKAKRRRGRPPGSTKFLARAIVDKLAAPKGGFGYLLLNRGKKGFEEKEGKPSPGELLFRLMVEGTANAEGRELGGRKVDAKEIDPQEIAPEETDQRDIKLAIRDYRRARKPKA